MILNENIEWGGGGGIPVRIFFAVGVLNVSIFFSCLDESNFKNLEIFENLKILFASH